MKRNFEVDIDNPTELKKLISKLQKRRKEVLRSLGYNEVYFDGCKYNMDNIYPLMESVYAADLSNLYPANNSSNDYYVYLHCNPLDPIRVKNDIRFVFMTLKFNLQFQPFYVGKGNDGRYLDFNRNEGHRKIRTKILKANKEIISIKIAENLSEAKAFETESKIIDLLGLKTLSNSGLLINLDEGKNAKERRLMYPKHDYLNRFLKRNGFTI